jgi:hypothetical protein
MRRRDCRVHRNAAIVSIVVSFLLTALAFGESTEDKMSLYRLRAESPEIRVYEEGGRISRIYGQAFGSGLSPEDAAEQFRMEHSGVFGAKAEDFRPESLLEDKRHTQPMVYDPETGDYKFTLVYYSQCLDDIPVFRSDMRLLVRNEPGFPIVLAASALRDLGDFQVDNLSSVDPDLGRSVVEAYNPRLTDFTEHELIIWAGYDDIESEPTLAFRSTGSNDFPEKLLYITDAITGEILYEEDQIIFEDVVGNVSGYVTEGTAAEHCEEEVLTAMPYAGVSIGGNEVYADSSGDFVIPYEGTSIVIVRSQVRGEFFEVFNNAGEDAMLSQSIVPPGPADFIHNALNTEMTRAEVNAYLHANIVRDITLKHNPSYPGVSTQIGFPVYVNRSDGYCPCNAWYNGSSINFCMSGSGCPNTSFSTVVHHEYGHHLVQMAASGQDQYGEGMSDVMGILITDQSGTGYGFGGSCSYPLRDADNNMQYPCYGGSHYCGKLMSGCVWSLRNELLATNPDDYRDILANLAINAMLLHRGSDITPQITIDYLTIDDDDADLYNGTPHWDEICAAFGAHNMDCPEMDEIRFNYPNGLPELADPDSGVVFRVDVIPGVSTPIEGSGVLHYSIDGGPFEIGSMSEISPNEYQAELPGADCQSTIEWYVVASSSVSGAFSDPPDAPTTVYSVRVASDITIVFEDDFETHKTWTEFGSASDGRWQRGVPAGDGSFGDPTSDFDGSGQCYLTGNEAGDSDVDSGTTVLVSPMVDLAGKYARLSYARWYSNDAGYSPHTDKMNIQISTNGGTNWLTLEAVGPITQASGGWYQRMFWVNDYITPTEGVKIRFIASDLNQESVVEAAIDAVSIEIFTCWKPYLCGDVDESEAVDIDDVVFLVNYIFAEGQSPEPVEAGDADCSGDVDIDDVVYVIAYIFSGGLEPCAHCP